METYEEGSLHCSGYLSGQHQTHGMAWHGKLSSNYTLLLASATQSHSDLNDLQEVQAGQQLQCTKLIRWGMAAVMVQNNIHCQSGRHATQQYQGRTPV